MPGISIHAKESGSKGEILWFNVLVKAYLEENSERKDTKFKALNYMMKHDLYLTDMRLSDNKMADEIDLVGFKNDKPVSFTFIVNSTTNTILRFAKIDYAMMSTNSKNMAEDIAQKNGVHPLKERPESPSRGLTGMSSY